VSAAQAAAKTFPVPSWGRAVLMTNASPSAGFPDVDVGWHHGGMVRRNLPSRIEPSRRYRTSISGWIFILSILVFFLLMAVVSIIIHAGLLLVVMMWATVLLTMYAVWTVWVTYIDIGPDDVLIRMRGKTHIIAWDDLDEIRWVSEGRADFPYFCTSDGRQVRCPFGVSHLGMGKRHVRRIVDDALQTWQQHSQEQAASRGRPVRVFQRRSLP